MPKGPGETEFWPVQADFWRKSGLWGKRYPPDAARGGWGIYDLIQNEEIKKGNVLTTAQIAGIQAVKNTSSIIPLCHPLALTGIELNFEVKEDEIIAICAVNTLGKTGVEMEAITGVSVALLTVWDMVKAVEKDEDGQYPDTRISDIKVIKKEKI